MASRSYVMGALRVLAMNRNRFWAAQEIMGLMGGGYAGHVYPWGYSEHALRGVLSELVVLGLLRTNGEAWSLGGANGQDDGGGTGRSPPGNDDGGDEGDDGRGGGLAEVLSHPVLFSADDADFDRALTAALSS